MQIFTKHSFPANSISQCPLTFLRVFSNSDILFLLDVNYGNIYIYIFIYMGYFLYYLHRVRGQYNFVQINWIAIEFIYLQAYLQTDKIIRQTESLLGLVIWYRWLYTVFLFYCQWTYVLQIFKETELSRCEIVGINF